MGGGAQPSQGTKDFEITKSEGLPIERIPGSKSQIVVTTKDERSCELPTTDEFDDDENP